MSLILSTFPVLLGAVDETLLLAASSLGTGFVLALGLALAGMSDNPVISGLSRGYVYIFRSTPLLVQIFLVYYGSGQFRPFLQEIGLWVFFRNPWFCGILALALNTAAYGCVILQGGLRSVPPGQIEAARAVGMSPLAVFRRIRFPLAIRQALPAYGNEVILMVKATSLASTITLVEITRASKDIISRTYRPVEVFIVAGALYLLINLVVTRLFALAERRLSRSR